VGDLGTPRVLLTGASGVVGHAVLQALRDDQVVGLVRQGSVLLPAARTLRGDVTQPRLGLDHDDYDRLARSLETIVHSAALTDWGLPPEAYRSVNVDGTRHVVELARAAGAPVVYVSTAFVAALRSGREAALAPDNVTRSYLASKLAAEQLLVDSGVPFTILRPTNLVGDSHTGAASRKQIVQHVSEWLVRGRLPVFPAHPDNRVDVAPLDLLAHAVAACLAGGHDGEQHWITYGPEAMTVDDALAVCTSHAQDRGRMVTPPRIVHPEALDPQELAELPEPVRRVVKVLADISEVVDASGGVLPTSLPRLRERYGLRPVDDRVAYRRSLDYWADGGVAATAVATGTEGLP
jgi:nucleoside-diphosphate-sugar epimerase